MKEKIAIKDACVIIDLIELKLLDAFFMLELQPFTTHLVLEEISKPTQKEVIDIHIANGNLHLDAFGQLETVLSLLRKYKGLSLADASVLEFATRTESIILTADQSLRMFSEQEGVEVHGVIWIIEMMFFKEVISSESLIQTLRAYSQINKWSPKKEIDRIIKFHENNYSTQNVVKTSNNQNS